MKFRRLLSLLTAGVMVTAMLPMSVANAKMEKADYIYYEDFDEADREFSKNTLYIARHDSVNVASFKIVDGALEVQTSARATNMTASSNAGIAVYPKTHDPNKYSSDYINTNDGVVHYEFKMKTSGVSVNEHLNAFARITGYNLDNTTSSLNVGGLVLTNGTYSTSWKNTINSIKRTLIETNEWLTHRITLDKANSIYRYDLYNAGEQRIGGFEIKEQAIPDVVNALNFTIYKNGSTNETYPNDYNTTMYFDDFKVWQDKPDNAFTENFDDSNFATTNITSIVDDTDAADGKALKIDPTSSIKSTDIRWNENISTKDAPVTIDTRFRANKVVDKKDDDGNDVTTTYLNQLSQLVGYNVDSTGEKTSATLVGLYDGATYFMVGFSFYQNLQKSSGTAFDKFKNSEYMTFRQVIDGKNQTYYAAMLDDNGKVLEESHMPRTKADGKICYTVPDYINASRIGFDKGNGQTVYIDSIKVTKNFQQVEKSMPLDKEISADDTIKLVFKHDVDSETIADAISLTKNGETLSAENYTASLASDGKTVEIKLTNAVGGDKYAVTVNDKLNANSETFIETETGYKYTAEFTIAKADGIYYEDFANGADGESWIGASNLSIAKLKSVESVSDAKATDGKAIKVNTQNTNNTSGQQLTINTDEEFDLSNGPIEAYARVRFEDFTDNTIFNNFFDMSGYRAEDESKETRRYCGLYGGATDEKLSVWYGYGGNVFPISIFKSKDYVTLKFRINADGSMEFSHSVDGVNYTLDRKREDFGTNVLPNVINKLVFGLDMYTDTKPYTDTTNAEYYIDYIKVFQESTAKLTVSEPTENAEASAKYDISATFDYKLQNYTNGVNVYIAAYNDGVLEKVDMVSSAKSAKDTVTATVEGVSANATIKAFVWDNNMKPIEHSTAE